MQRSWTLYGELSKEGENGVERSYQRGGNYRWLTKTLRWWRLVQRG